MMLTLVVIAAMAGDCSQLIVAANKATITVYFDNRTGSTTMTDENVICTSGLGPPSCWLCIWDCENDKE